MNYWQECIEVALAEAELEATSEQIEIIAGAVESGHENYGMAHGHDCIPNPLVTEKDKLKRELEKERDKRICPECKGRGWITIQGPIHSGTSQCYKCKGEGKT